VGLAQETSRAPFLGSSPLVVHKKFRSKNKI
jgi:hypothetical protein